MTKHIHQIMIANIIQNYNHKHSNHYWIIKYIGFKPIIYAINLEDVSSSKVSNVLQV